MIIQMSDLNNEQFGRFGNQLFKFLFLKVIEKEIDCEIRCPDWLGNLAFNIESNKEILPFDDLLVINPNENLSIDNVLEKIRGKISSGSKVLEIKGFFQFHTSDYSKYKDIYFETFRINSIFSEQLINALANANPEQSNIISVHIRRGDYLNYSESPLFWTTKIDSILESMVDIGLSDYKNSLIYLCSDDMRYCTDALNQTGLKYITADNLFTYQDESMRLLIDYFMMANAKINVISNSSLSFFASMQNTEAKVFLRPHPERSYLIPYDPWNSNVLISKN